MKTALVLGAGGFIGSHLVKRLKKEGYWVRGVDLKYPEFSETQVDEFILGDLRDHEFILSVVRLDQDLTHSFLPKPFAIVSKFDEIYQLAADMGGAGYVFTGDNDAEILSNSSLINLNLLRSLTWNFDDKGKAYPVSKIFYSSSACMYPQELQNDSDSPYKILGLKESDAYPANPDSDYGWEKLFSERLYLAHARNYNLDVRIGRFHNIYGPEGTYKGGKEKAPAAICRKVIEAASNHVYVMGVNRNAWRNGGEPTIEIWGDGEQTRSFLFIDDCIDAVRLLMQSDFNEPINIGSEEMVTINQLAEMAIAFEGKSITIKHIEGPTGVRGRNSDNTLIRKVLGWEPKYQLFDGLYRTYNWIKSEHDRH